MRIAFGDDPLDLLARPSLTMPALVLTRSSRHIPGFRAMPGGDHEDVGARRLVVAVGADDPGVEAFDRAGLPLVERLALRNALDDVDHHDGAGEILLGQSLGGRGADVAGADDGNLSRAFPWVVDRAVESRLAFHVRRTKRRKDSALACASRRSAWRGFASYWRSASYSTIPARREVEAADRPPTSGIVKQRSGCFSRIRAGMPSVSLPKTRQLFGRYGASQ